MLALRVITTIIMVNITIIMVNTITMLIIDTWSEQLRALAKTTTLNVVVALPAWIHTHLMDLDGSEKKNS